MVPIRVTEPHSVVLLKCEVTLWRAGSAVCPVILIPSSKPRAHLSALASLGGFSQNQILPWVEERNEQLCVFPALFCQDSASDGGLTPSLISTNVPEAEGSRHKKNSSDSTSSVLFAQSAYRGAWITRKLRFRIFSFFLTLVKKQRGTRQGLPMALSTASVPGPTSQDEGRNFLSAGNNLPFPKTSGGFVFL